MAKQYKLSANEVVAGLAANDSCFATDRITVDGMPVGFMYREGAQWNFFAGDEDQDYVDDPCNVGLFSLNEIANFDRAILPYVHAASDSAWVREGDHFTEDPQGVPADPDSSPTGKAADEALNPAFPVVEGLLDINSNWSITLDQPMNRRIEDGSLVLWRPGLTVWMDVWGMSAADRPQQRLSDAKRISSPDRYDAKEWEAGGLIYYSYRVNESGRRHALYGNVIGKSSHALLAVYFDAEDDVVAAHDFVARISAKPTPGR